MNESPRDATGILAGVRAVDWLIAGALTALGAALMVMNIQSAPGDSEGLAHPIDTRTWWLLPTYLVAPAVILWWRRNLFAVIGIAIVAMGVHTIAFGWVVRCGAGLPEAFVLSFLAGLAYPELARALRAWAASVCFAATVLALDSAAGIAILPVVGLIGLLLCGAGRLVGQRAALASELETQTAELQLLRDRRATLEVSGDRARLAAELEGLLDQRLDELSRAARPLDDPGPDALLSTFTDLEEESRRTLADMRRIVGDLRGADADVALSPAPTVAHLDALLARHAGPDGRISVSGNPRSLPPSVELSAYRIVEHLIGVLTHEPDRRIDVTMRFDDEALEIQVVGPVGRRSEVRAAVGRARERARLHDGSFEIKVSRGQARAVALLPLVPAHG